MSKSLSSVRHWVRCHPVWAVVLSLFGASVVVAGCASIAGDLGVTTGGQQDIAAARAVIADGGVPDPDWITVEGMLSEHRIPIEAPAEPDELFISAGAAWNVDFDTFTPLATVVIGFGTTIDMATFERDPLNLAIVVDRSGSMGEVIDERSGATKLDAVKIAIDRLLAQLDGNDLVSLVTFNVGTNLRVEAAAGDDVAAIKSGLDEVTADGGTDLARGMERAYLAVRRHRNDTRADRLLVFTDALLTERSDRQALELLAVMREYAALDIGASIFAVGTNFSQEVAFDISRVRGGNYFFLSDYDRIVSVFDEEFDFLVTPVAFDVTLDVDVPFALDVQDVYGIPVEEPLPHQMQLAIPTLFLSRRQGGGAVFIRLRAGAMADFSTAQSLAEIDFSFTDRTGARKTAPTITAALPAGLDPEEAYFGNEAVRRGVLLVNTALALKRASADVRGPRPWWADADDRARAVERLSEFLGYFDTVAAALPDQTSDASRRLSQERVVVAQLLANIEGLN